MSGDASHLIVCEPEPRWSRLLRQVAAEVGIELREVRALEQVWAVLEEAPRSVVCLHVTSGNFARCMAAVQRMKQRHPILVMALPVRAFLPWAWHAREFGTDQVLGSPLELRPAAALIRRHRSRRCQPVDLPQAGSTEGARDRIWKRLPWKGHATGGS